MLFQGARPEVEVVKWGEPLEYTTKTSNGKQNSTYIPPESLLYNNHIGSDESGTGDYFGPITNYYMRSVCQERTD